MRSDGISLWACVPGGFFTRVTLVQTLGQNLKYVLGSEIKMKAPNTISSTRSGNFKLIK